MLNSPFQTIKPIINPAPMLVHYSRPDKCPRTDRTSFTESYTVATTPLDEHILGICAHPRAFGVQEEGHVFAMNVFGRIQTKMRKQVKSNRTCYAKRHLLVLYLRR